MDQESRWYSMFKRLDQNKNLPTHTLGCSIPNTKMEFGQGRPRTGCLMTPLVSIQNLGPEKFQEGVSRELVSLKVCDLSKKGNPFTQISKYWPRAKVKNIARIAKRCPSKFSFC